MGCARYVSSVFDQHGHVFTLMHGKVLWGIWVVWVYFVCGAEFKYEVQRIKEVKKHQPSVVGATYALCSLSSFGTIYTPLI